MRQVKQADWRTRPIGIIDSIPVKMDGSNEVSWLEFKPNVCSWLNPVNKDASNEVSWLPPKDKSRNWLQPVNVPANIEVIWRELKLNLKELIPEIGYHANNWFLSKTTPPLPLCAPNNNKTNIKKHLHILLFLSQIV